ncbi:MAG: molecular chaperone TorD family protein [Bacillota bacterium]|nr:molecular chaperone TorD family protein [Bacillota bacterium]
MDSVPFKQQNELIPILIARKNFYQFLIFLFSEPKNNEYFIEIRDNGKMNELEEMGKGGQLLHHFFLSLTDEKIKAEKEEYSRLFLGPGPIRAPLWASFYLSKDHLLFDESTYQVRKFYHQYGLQYIKENNEPDDHLLLEIEFMVSLIDSCSEETDRFQINRLLADQIYFLTTHLLPWIPAFMKTVIKNTESQLYKGAVLLLHDFLTFDLEVLCEIKEAILE